MSERFADMSIAELINKWNDSTWSAKARDALRIRLNWDPMTGLGDLVERHYGNGSVLSGRVGGARQTVRTSLKKEHDFQSMWKMIHERNGKTDQIASPILSSGWDFVDRRPEDRGRFDMPADRIQDFLEDMAVDDYYIDELTDKQVGLMQAVFKAWRHWVRVAQKED
jgi:hypothetical protein